MTGLDLVNNLASFFLIKIIRLVTRRRVVVLFPSIAAVRQTRATRGRGVGDFLSSAQTLLVGFIFQWATP